jgi:hypothetical protein
MKSKLRSIALLALGSGIIAGAASDSLRSLRFRVVTSYGDELKYDLVSLDSNQGESAVSHCKDLRCTDLKFGLYRYKLVRPSTRDVLEGTILVSEPEQVLTVDAGPGGGSASRDTEGFTIDGLVRTPQGMPPPEWVRLQALYSQWNILVAVEPTGRFVLEYVPPGASILVVFRSGKIVHTELISTDKAKSKRVRLEVTLAGPPAIVSVQ